VSDPYTNFEKSTNTDHVSPVQNPAIAPRGVFSFFRTGLNLPSPLFSSSKTSAKDRSEKKDLDTASSIRQEKGLSLTNNSTTISTNIWSNTASSATPKTQSASRIHKDDDEEIGPLSPKLGSRAYREREKREVEAEEKSCGTRNGSGHGGCKHETCHGCGKEGVLVKTLMERREEVAGPAFEPASASMADPAGKGFDHVTI